MISLLEKEAKDPVEVLRVKLKDSTETSLLNSQLLQEIKHDYLLKQNSTKGQLDAFVQAHVDEIERASSLLEFENTVTQIVENLTALGSNCSKMNEELGEKRLTSGISVARRNLKELENQIIFYEELPAKIEELHQVLDARVGDIAAVYTKWQSFDDWRQKTLHELKSCASDRTDELSNSKNQARLLESMSSRLFAVESLLNFAAIVYIHLRCLAEVYGCMQHCIEICQFNKKRLMDCFQVLEIMERRRKRLSESNREYLDNSLKTVADIKTSYYEKCKEEVSSFLKRKISEMFRLAEAEAEANEKKNAIESVLSSATNLLMDLETVHTDVVPCFPNEIDVLQIYTSTYTTSLEEEITKLCSKPDIGIADRLQLVQWIEYYNTEIIKYKRARASVVLEHTSQMLMTQYIDQIQGQITMWINNIWKRQEEHIIGPNGELQSTRPNDIINILKSQISIGQEWLTGVLLGRVVVSCLEALMDQLKTRHITFSSKLADTDIETICSFINDTDVLQAKCPELVQEISFAETSSEEKEAFDNFMGDALDTTSVDIVKLAMSSSQLIVDKVFAEVENDTLKLWFSKKWDEGESVVENLLVTLDDYYSDLKRWICGSFFFSKLVRQCLDRSVREYTKRLSLRSHSFSNASQSASLVENDLKSFVTFFEKYSSELRRTGIRTNEDLRKEFTVLQLIADRLKGQTSETNSDIVATAAAEHKDVLAHLKRLIPSSQQQIHQDHSGGEKSSKSTTKKSKKTKVSSKDKKSKKSDKSGTIEEENDVDATADFQVNNLNLNDFLK